MAKLSLPGTDPNHKVTIIPAGRALGVTSAVADGRSSQLFERLFYNNLAIPMGAGE